MASNSTARSLESNNLKNDRIELDGLESVFTDDHSELFEKGLSLKQAVFYYGDTRRSLKVKVTEGAVPAIRLPESHGGKWRVFPDGVPEQLVHLVPKKLRPKKIKVKSEEAVEAPETNSEISAEMLKVVEPKVRKPKVRKAKVQAEETNVLGTESNIQVTEAQLATSEAQVQEPVAYIQEPETFTQEPQAFIQDTETLVQEPQAFVQDTETFVQAPEAYVQNTQAYSQEFDPNSQFMYTSVQPAAEEISNSDQENVLPEQQTETTFAVTAESSYEDGVASFTSYTVEFELSSAPQGLIEPISQEHFEQYLLEQEVAGIDASSPSADYQTDNNKQFQFIDFSPEQVGQQLDFNPEPIGQTIDFSPGQDSLQTNLAFSFSLKDPSTLNFITGAVANFKPVEEADTLATPETGKKSSVRYAQLQERIDTLEKQLADAHYRSSYLETRLTGLEDQIKFLTASHYQSRSFNKLLFIIPGIVLLAAIVLRLGV